MASATGEQTTLAERKRRAGQRLIMGIAGPAVSSAERALIRELQPAGFVLFARNVAEPAQVRELNRELRSLVPEDRPAIRTVDQEGGRVQRIRATRWPPMRTVGNVGDLVRTRACGYRMGRELRAMAFDLNWAPVADVASNPKNPVIGDRSFGEDPDRVADHAIAFFEGQREAGVMGCFKHFPGHGDTSVDSHLDLPVVDRDRGDLERLELRPFARAVAAGADVVMTAHVVFPALDEAHPATLSAPILQGLLRERLGFKGVLVSDDLEMKAVRGRFPLDEQLDLGARASIDLFLVCESPELQLQAWEELVRLQEAHKAHDDLARDSFQRVQDLRRRHLLGQDSPPGLDEVGCSLHTELALGLDVLGRS